MITISMISSPSNIFDLDSNQGPNNQQTNVLPIANLTNYNSK